MLNGSYQTIKYIESQIIALNVVQFYINTRFEAKLEALQLPLVGWWVGLKTKTIYNIPSGNCSEDRVSLLVTALFIINVYPIHSSTIYYSLPFIYSGNPLLIKAGHSLIATRGVGG